MKNISKILTTAFFVGIAMTFSPTAEAQFLKKLSKGLEKLNKTLEQVNNTASEILDGTALQNKSQTKAKQTESDANTVNAKSADNTTAIAVDQSPKVAVIDDSRWDDAEPVYNTPYITPKTRFLQIGEYDEFSDVHEGIFGIKKNGSDIISFWKITGEKLFDSEWKYCGHTASYHDPFPEFSGGVAPALRTVPNAQGNKVVCLLYSNGGFK
jgi:plastocyanin